MELTKEQWLKFEKQFTFDGSDWDGITTKTLHKISSLIEKAEILDMGQENNMFKVAKFAESLADIKAENKELKEVVELQQGYLDIAVEENKQLRENFMFANKWASEQTQTINNLKEKLGETIADLHIANEMLTTFSLKLDEIGYLPTYTRNSQLFLSKDEIKAILGDKK